MNNLPIPINIYNDIFNSILPIVKLLKEDYILEKACIPINLFACNILRKIYPNLTINFFAGNVIYNIDNIILQYLDPNDHISLNNWHTYIIIKDEKEEFYYIDFVSPLFSKIVKKNIGIKMFQKNCREMKSYDFFAEEKTEKGDFYFNCDENIIKPMINDINNSNLGEYMNMAEKLYFSSKKYIKVINVNEEKIDKIYKSKYNILKYW